MKTMKTKARKLKSARDVKPVNGNGQHSRWWEFKPGERARFAAVQSLNVKCPPELAPVITALIQHVQRAQAEHPQPYVDGHHVIGIATEEFDEVKAVVAMREMNYARLHHECLDLAAVGVRACLDVCPPTLNPAKR